MESSALRGADAGKGHSAESPQLLAHRGAWCPGQLLENKMSPPAWVAMAKATSLHKGACGAIFLGMSPPPDTALRKPPAGLQHQVEKGGLPG